MAVALAYQRDSGQEAPILQAEDSGWAEFGDALAAHGVRVDSVCEEDIQP